MFIPRNEPVHKNLSTSYILVESLVDDLREGGFSGVVETTLREGDLFIVFSQGTILAAGSPGAGGNSSAFLGGENDAVVGARRKRL